MSVNRTVAVATVVALCVLAPNAHATLIGPASAPAGKEAVARLDVGSAPRACAVAARSGKVRQGPIKLRVGGGASLLRWKVPANAARTRWTVSVRCAATAKRAAKAKAETLRVSVRTTRKHGKRVLIARGSLRAASAQSGKLLGETPAEGCASAWNGYESVLDDSGYCTGYDTWYVFTQLKDERLRGLGPASAWYAAAPDHGLLVAEQPAIGAIAWWRTHVAVVSDAAPNTVTVREMNQPAWNTQSTRTISLESGDAPQGYILLAAPRPPSAEVISLERSAQGPAYGLWRRGEGGAFARLAGGLGAHDYPWNLLVADADGDHRADLLTLEYQSPGVSEWVLAHSNGDGTFTRKVASGGFGGSYPSAAAAGDFDGDGRADLVLVEGDGRGHADYVIAHANAGGTFTRRPAVATADEFPLQRGIDVADFDGNGRADILSLEYGGVTPPHYVVAFANTDGTVTRRETERFELPGDTLAGDVNGDGRGDIITLTGGDYVIWLGNTDRTFTRLRTPAPPHGGIKEITVGDVNADGRADIITAEPGDGTTTYYAALANADMSFTRTMIGTAPDYPILIAAGDIDGS